MRFALHRLVVSLESRATCLQEDWALIWAGWPTSQAGPDICLHLELVETLPALPATTPYFCDARPADAGGILTVYRGEKVEGGETAVLHYLDGALVSLPLPQTGAAAPLRAEGVVTAAVRQQGRFEDITFTSLAPLLRRHGYYLLHAFAVVKEAECRLLVGPSGSGKTTTGLHLLQQGWQLLGNDLVLLENRPDGVYALPTPGMVGIRPGSLTLLPALAAQLGLAQLPLRRLSLSGRQLTGGKWGEAGRVTAVYFPQFQAEPAATTTPLPAAIHLAQLMAESIDRWDEAVLTDHMHLLARLSQQAPAYQLNLTRGRLPDLT